MAEYIEREKVIERIDLSIKSWSADYNSNSPNMVRAYKDVKSRLESIPAADVAPVVHGEWEIRCETHHDTHTGETDEEFYLECSECKRRVWEVSQDAIIMGDYRKAIADFPYCHCGAKMDGERRSE